MVLLLCVTHAAREAVHTGRTHGAWAGAISVQQQQHGEQTQQSGASVTETNRAFFA
eukprot:TRINITY_DN304_c0_g1_i4.p1 TRINITY_DN304_c0_g1~~TRINITY_DN304_c0_g1_i4.p1  ORF type:complete len:56 (-),score=6.72 TRINITY_DN304_c0_g1_i4:361-528(-)